MTSPEDDPSPSSGPKLSKYGTRAAVWDNIARQTRGGLKREDLILSKTGKIVSLKKSQIAKENYLKYGFRTREPEKKKKKRKRKKV